MVLTCSFLCNRTKWRWPKQPGINLICTNTTSSSAFAGQIPFCACTGAFQSNALFLSLIGTVYCSSTIAISSFKTLSSPWSFFIVDMALCALDIFKHILYRISSSWIDVLYHILSDIYPHSCTIRFNTW